MSLATSFRSAVRGIAITFLLMTASPVWADWRSQLPGAALVGQGDFTWFGLSVYQARLWSPASTVAWDQPFALELSYRRALSRDNLVQASIEEMRRLGGSSTHEARLADWEREMRKAFVGVQPGQRITGLYLPGKGASFYVDDQLRHTVADADFARAFFAIWLDARARHPELRRALLGVSESR